MLRFNKRIIITVCLLAVITAVSIFVFAEERRDKRDEEVYQDMERFGTVLAKIMDYYVKEMDSQELIDAAIEGMLSELDPHSVYLNKHQWENLMIDTQGEFGGLGITISIRDKFPTVISPIEGTPAYRLGIQGGDRIIEIEGTSTKGWSSEEAVSKLRGRPGTQVNVTISREGLDDSLCYTITREIIQVPSITYWDNINGVGYIRIARFAQRTAQELDEIIDDFEEQGIRGLVLDLRSNPGGLLDAAKDVSELFLERGRLIVSTESRIQKYNNKYESDARSIHNGYPIVVLVNGASASASEIVAGALQDWDRAVIVGQRTFGKGSVQTVFQIGGESALKLTTQKYFTPVGRSIHRDDAPEGEEENVSIGAEADSTREEYHTYGGRVVYGGGGIMPDWKIVPETLTDVQRKLEMTMVFFSFAVHYTAYHDLDESFEPSDEVFEEFKEFCASKEVTIEDEAWTDANIDYAKMGIEREVFRKLFGTRGAYIATLGEDETLNKVLQMFNEAPTLREMFSYVERQEEPVGAGAE
jgi:carboxyl-terminal processing protease